LNRANPMSGLLLEILLGTRNGRRSKRTGTVLGVQLLERIEIEAT
jgi:hypothetical protein